MVIKDLRGRKVFRGIKVIQESMITVSEVNKGIKAVLKVHKVTEGLHLKGPLVIRPLQDHKDPRDYRVPLQKEYRDLLVP